MKILSENLGKRFNFNWIFRNLNLNLESGNCYAVIGPNGSGKSTFLQTIAGSSPLSEGSVKYYQGTKEIHADNIYRYLSIAAPYLELIEEFTLKEQLELHFKFKKLREGISLQQIPELLWLEKSINKEIRFFSSGMKQRLKLGLAFFSDSPILILDEPTSNLDRDGFNWYKEHIKSQFHKLILIGSNQEEEYDFCQEKIKMGGG